MVTVTRAGSMPRSPRSRSWSICTSIFAVTARMSGLLMASWVKSSKAGPAPRDGGGHTPDDAELGVHEVARPRLDLERRRQQAVGALAAVDEDALDVLGTDVVLGDQRQRRIDEGVHAPAAGIGLDGHVDALEALAQLADKASRGSSERL